MWRTQRGLARALLHGVRTQLRAGTARGSTSIFAEGLQPGIIQPPCGSFLGHGLGINHMWSKGFRSSSCMLVKRDIHIHEMTDDEESFLTWPPPDGFLDIVDPELAREIMMSEEADLELESKAVKAQSLHGSPLSIAVQVHFLVPDTRFGVGELLPLRDINWLSGCELCIYLFKIRNDDMPTRSALMLRCLVVLKINAS
eukprot:749442-Pyramimonas_sp.AAC.1